MSRSRITLLILLSAPFSLGLAERDAQVDGILKPIVAKIASDPNVGSWEWVHNRNGGYLLRMQMDVTGDGHPELFVASTLESSKHADVWHVFDVNGDGWIRPYSTTLNFTSATPRTENGLHSLDLFPSTDQERLRMSDEKPYRVLHYFFSYPTIKETTSYVSESEAIKLQSPDPNHIPLLQAILFADYLTKPDAKWADVTDLKLDSNDYLFRPEDKERAEKNTAFTPQAALSMLGLAQPTPHNSSKESIPKPPPVVQPSAQQNAPESKHTLPTSEEPTSLTAWSIIVVLMVATGGLLWLLVKKQK